MYNFTDQQLKTMLVSNENVACDSAAPFEEVVKDRLDIARELLLRAASHAVIGQPAMGSPGAAKDYLRLHFAGIEYEAFVVIFLDHLHRIISAEEMFRGTLTQTAVYPREIVKRALHLNAAGVLLAHNHPSGVADPSQADRTLTFTLKSVLGTVDVRVVDHFVVAGQNVCSFAENNIL